MIQRIIVSTIPFLVFFILLFVYTKIAGPIPFAINSVNTNKFDTFNVSGEGKVSVTPDVAQVSAGILAQGTTVKSTQDSINKVINQVSQDLKKQGIDAKDIQTANYSINPNYDYTSSVQRITGYSASTTLVIKVRDIEKINSVIDVATTSGANQIGGISFEIEDKTEGENKAREMAVNDAKTKAAQAAKIAGFSLGRLINYQEDFSGTPPIMYEKAVTADSKEVSPTQVESGSNEITVTVTLNYEIR